MSRKNNILGLTELKNADFLDISILMSILNFMLNEKKSFITSGPGYKTFLLCKNGRKSEATVTHFPFEVASPPAAV